MPHHAAFIAEPRVPSNTNFAATSAEAHSSDVKVNTNPTRNQAGRGRPARMIRRTSRVVEAWKPIEEVGDDEGKNAIWLWGRAGNGRLGVGNDMTDRMIPGLLPTFSGGSLRVKSVTCGSQHTVAIVNDGVNEGALFAWGNNSSGQLGVDDNPAVVPTPRKVEFLALKTVKTVACGHLHTLAIVGNKNELYSWGEGAEGKLGHGNEQDCYKPTPVRAAKKLRVVAIDGGKDHSVAISNDGTLLTWGCNQYGQLGHGQGIGREMFPRVVEFFQERSLHPKQVVCGDNHTVILLEGATVYTCGKGTDGQLGHGNLSNVYTPTFVKNIDVHINLKTIGAGARHTVAVTSKNTLYMWGIGSFLSKDRRDNAVVSSPRHLEYSSLHDVDISKVECGADFTVLVSASGGIFSWGLGMQGRLGHSSVSHRGQLAPSRAMDMPTPNRIETLERFYVSDISCGLDHVACVTSDEPAVFTPRTKISEEVLQKLFGVKHRGSVVVDRTFVTEVDIPVDELLQPVFDDSDRETFNYLFMPGHENKGGAPTARSLPDGNVIHDTTIPIRNFQAGGTFGSQRRLEKPKTNTSLGPGQYFVKDDATRPSLSSVSFGLEERFEDDTAHLKKGLDPAPAQYNPQIKYKTPSFRFSTTSKHGHRNRAGSLVGPGSYLPSLNEKREQRGLTFQGSERKTELGVSQSIVDNPGPGEYRPKTAPTSSVRIGTQQREMFHKEGSSSLGPTKAVTKVGPGDYITQQEPKGTQKHKPRITFGSSHKPLSSFVPQNSDIAPGYHDVKVDNWKSGVSFGTARSGRGGTNDLALASKKKNGQTVFKNIREVDEGKYRKSAVMSRLQQRFAEHDDRMAITKSKKKGILHDWQQWAERDAFREEVRKQEEEAARAKDARINRARMWAVVCHLALRIHAFADKISDYRDDFTSNPVIVSVVRIQRFFRERKRRANDLERAVAAFKIAKAAKKYLLRKRVERHHRYAHIIFDFLTIFRDNMKIRGAISKFLGNVRLIQRVMHNAFVVQRTRRKVFAMQWDKHELKVLQRMRKAAKEEADRNFKKRAAGARVTGACMYDENSIKPVPKAIRDKLLDAKVRERKADLLKKKKDWQTAMMRWERSAQVIEFENEARSLLGANSKALIGQTPIPPKPNAPLFSVILRPKEFNRIYTEGRSMMDGEEDYGTGSEAGWTAEQPSSLDIPSGPLREIVPTPPNVNTNPANAAVKRGLTRGPSQLAITSPRTPKPGGRSSISRKDTRTARRSSIDSSTVDNPKTPTNPPSSRPRTSSKPKSPK